MWLKKAKAINVKREEKRRKSKYFFRIINKNTLQKIFGKVYDTYFFDCIKPTLASLFALGSPMPQLSEQIVNSKWTCVQHNGSKRVFGVVYKDNFAFAVAASVDDDFKKKEVIRTYKIDDKSYNIVFLSATNGKIIVF